MPSDRIPIKLPPDNKRHSYVFRAVYPILTFTTPRQHDGTRGKTSSSTRFVETFLPYQRHRIFLIFLPPFRKIRKKPRRRGDEQEHSSSSDSEQPKHSVVDDTMQIEEAVRQAGHVGSIVMGQNICSLRSESRDMPSQRIRQQSRKRRDKRTILIDSVSHKKHKILKTVW